MIRSAYHTPLSGAQTRGFLAYLPGMREFLDSLADEPLRSEPVDGLYLIFGGALGVQAIMHKAAPASLIDLHE